MPGLFLSAESAASHAQGGGLAYVFDDNGVCGRARVSSSNTAMILGPSKRELKARFEQLAEYAALPAPELDAAAAPAIARD